MLFIACHLMGNIVQSRSFGTWVRGEETWPKRHDNARGSPLFGQENVTNETFSCTEAVDAWCQSDPASAAQQQLKV